MSNASLIRFEDRDNILKTVLQHYNFSYTQPMFKLDLIRRLGSTLSLNSDKMDFDRRMQLLQTPRRSSGSVRNFIRRGSSAFNKPSRTDSFHNQQNMFNDDVSTTLRIGDRLHKKVFKFQKQRKQLEVKLTLPVPEQVVQNENLLKRLPIGCEGAVVLTAQVDFLEQPTLAFIRLTESVKIPNVLEVAIPVRFLFILLGPQLEALNYHEVGRSFSTLLSNSSFSTKAYTARNRRDLLSAINDFLDASLVLPPGKLEKDTLLPFDEIRERLNSVQKRKSQAIGEALKSQNDALSEGQLKFLSEKFETSQKKRAGPLHRTGRLWGGLINDLKRRLPMFKSDFTDGLNSDTFSATVFL